MKPRHYAYKTAFSMIAAILILAARGPAQTAAPHLEYILDAAEKQSALYVDTFQNLLAEETKSFDVFDKKGEVKKHKVIVSNFVVFPLSKDSSRIAEYRNVVSVDGKPQSGSDRRAEDFFSKIANAASSQKELDAIEAESLRQDEQIWISGLTLFQSFVLRREFRPYFQFHYEGIKAMPDGDAYVVSYRQTKAHPAISVNGRRDVPNSQNYDIDVDASGELNARVRGMLTIDAATFAIVAERRERTIQPAGAAEPIVAAVDTFSYRRSDFGIFTPAEIVHQQFRVKTKEGRSIRDIFVTFIYSKFTKPEVEVRSGEVRSN